MKTKTKKGNKCFNRILDSLFYIFTLLTFVFQACILGKIIPKIYKLELIEAIVIIGTVICYLVLFIWPFLKPKFFKLDKNKEVKLLIKFSMMIISLMTVPFFMGFYMLWENDIIQGLVVLYYILYILYFIINDVFERDIKTFSIMFIVSVIILQVLFILYLFKTEITSTLSIFGLGLAFMTNEILKYSKIPKNYHDLVYKLSEKDKIIVDRYVYIYKLFELKGKVVFITVSVLAVLLYKTRVFGFYSQSSLFLTKDFSEFLNTVGIYFFLTGIIVIITAILFVAIIVKEELIIIRSIFHKILLVEDIKNRSADIDKYIENKFKDAQIKHEKQEEQKDEQN